MQDFNGSWNSFIGHGINSVDSDFGADGTELEPPLVVGRAVIAEEIDTEEEPSDAERIDYRIQYAKRLPSW